MNNTVGMELQMEVTNITLHAINEQDKPEISYYTAEPDMKYMMAADGTGNYGNDANRNGGD